MLGHTSHSPAPASDHRPAGLSLSAGGFVFVPGATRFVAGVEQPLHLVVVRRDLESFQHVHPVRAEDGTWSTPLSLPEAGSYRAFADFRSDRRAAVLGHDLEVAGHLSLRPALAPTVVAWSGPYRFELTSQASPTAGESTELLFEVRRDWRLVTPEPYLGAAGHLVVLRQGDLAYLHAHPESGEGADSTLRFQTTFPTAGRYALFLELIHDGAVRSARLVVDAQARGPSGEPDHRPRVETVSAATSAHHAH